MAMINQHATRAVTEYGKTFRPGEFLPFYVPRADMPQIDEVDQIKLIVDACTACPTPEIVVVNTASLRAHQRIDHNRAINMAPDVKLKPIIISRDGYVLDGNHRWFAAAHDGQEMVVAIRLPMDFEQAIPWLLSLPYTYTIQPTTPIRD